ncbi:MAG: DNA helicase UvrB [Phycisphaerales bacterium]|nr:DNA helicase UvrB [Phycisphaerales bacterium]
MNCDRCPKAAVVHEVTIRDGVTREVHLCAEHASEAGYSLPTEQPVAKLLESFLAAAAAGVAGSPAQERSKGCAACGLTFAAFKQAGALGCAACYDALMPMIGQIIERSQGGAVAHVGRRPVGSESVQRTQAVRAKLLRDLEAAVTAEQYERAATLRDEIAALDELDQPGHLGMEPP